MFEDYYLDLTFKISDLFSLIFVLISVYLIWKTNDLQKKQIEIQNEQVRMEKERLVTHQFEYKHTLSSSLYQCFNCVNRKGEIPVETIDDIANNAHVLIAFFDEVAADYSLRCCELFREYNWKKDVITRFSNRYDLFVSLYKPREDLDRLRSEGRFEESVIASIEAAIVEFEKVTSQIVEMYADYGDKIAKHLKLN